MLDEKELIEKLLRGEEQAYREAVTRYQRSMMQVARAIIGERYADEVVQEAWLAVLKALPGFEGRSSLKTWLLRIVGNNAKTRLRKESRMISMGNLGEGEDFVTGERFVPDGHWGRPPHTWHSDTPDALLASEELRRRLQETLLQLPAMQQTVLRLRDMEGLSMTEICKILDISESNSRVLLHRARTRLWQTVDEFESE